jgi:hypothetical protein
MIVCIYAYLEDLIQRDSMLRRCSRTMVKESSQNYVTTGPSAGDEVKLITVMPA